MAECEPTVFILDDDKSIQDSMSALLLAMGQFVEIYSTVDDFFENYDPLRSGCLILDIRLPGDGLNVLKRLPNTNSALPVIVVTGHGDREIRNTASGLGAFAFFDKPCDSSKLCNCIQDAINPNIRGNNDDWKYTFDTLTDS